MQRKIRLKDVAEKAGVAINTASTILNRRPNSWASKATEERVFAAAKELGYRPSRTARALQSGRYETIGFLVQDLANPFYTTLADELESSVEEKNFNLLIENCRSSVVREKRVFEGLNDLEVDGAVLWLSDNNAYREELAKRFQTSMPLVALGNGVPDSTMPVDAIFSDFSDGLGEAIRSLHGLGHRRFIFLSAIAEGTSDGSRRLLVEELLADAKIPHENVEFLNCGPAIDSAYETFAHYLKKAPAGRPTALIGMNDLSALGAMRAALDAGLSIPGDLSVVGVDDIPFASYSPIALSSVRQRYRKISQMATELILSRLDEKNDASQGPRQIVFPTHFVPRESIGQAAE
jgi:LacI family transcriptional regulator